MTEYTVSCGNCGRQLEINDSQIGKNIYCPECGACLMIRQESLDGSVSENQYESPRLAENPLNNYFSEGFSETPVKIKFTDIVVNIFAVFCKYYKYFFLWTLAGLPFSLLAVFAAGGFFLLFDKNFAVGALLIGISFFIAAILGSGYYFWSIKHLLSVCRGENRSVRECVPKLEDLWHVFQGNMLFFLYLLSLYLFFGGICIAFFIYIVNGVGQIFIRDNGMALIIIPLILIGIALVLFSLFYISLKMILRFFTSYFIIDRKMKPLDAFYQSRRYVKISHWSIWGVFNILAMITQTISSFLSIPGTVLGSFFQEHEVGLVIFFSGLQLIFNIFFSNILLFFVFPITVYLMMTGGKNTFK